ncbi:hypothetical protein [Lacticaseibacillus kribbianus]|uniref:hypothetical protein n=1 Tax=Lacticaseibacillus kribbianus TaxID=2926292 RepID=UPI001CD4C343|nr:hypothetical protein [Lacticaseibacillus kribbianus]
MTGNAPLIRVNVTLSDVFFGNLLDDTLHLTHTEMLVVTVDSLVLSDDTEIPITPVQVLLEFDPTQTPLGLLWRVGDAFQVSGRLHKTHLYPGRVQFEQLSRLRESAIHDVTGSTRTWLRQIPRPTTRAMLSRSLKRFILNDITFAQFQNQLRTQSRPLSSRIRRNLRTAQDQQMATWRALRIAMTQLAPDTFIITHPTTIRVRQLTSGGKLAMQINRDRAADDDYHHQLLMSIHTHERWINPGDPPRVHLPNSESNPTSGRAPGHAAPVQVSLTVTVRHAETVCLAPKLGPLPTMDALAATVTAFDLPPQATDGSGAAFNPHFATFLVYDAALARLQLTPGWQGVLTGTFNQVRLVVPAQQAALVRAQQQVLHRLRQLLDQSLAATGDPVLPIYARLSTRLAAGKLGFADYLKRLGKLRAADPPLAARQTAAWRAYTHKYQALTRPAWFLADITDQVTTDGGEMLPMLAIDAARLTDASYRHQLFEQWQQNAAGAVAPLDQGPAD